MIKSYQLIAKDIPNGLWVAFIVGITLRLFSAAFIEVSSLNEASWFKVPVVPFDIPPSLSQSHYQECQFLREEMGLNAYSIGSNSDLGSFHHNCHAMPLMVSCFAGLPRFGFILIDVFTAIMLYAFAASIVKCPSVEEREKIYEVKHCPAKIRPSYGWIYDITNFSYDDTEDKGSLCDKNLSLIKWCNVPLIISTCFLVSPFAIFASAYRSLQSFMILVQISAIFSAREGNLFATGLLLAVATYVDVYPFVYLLPLSSLTSKKSPKNNLLRLSVFFTVSIAVLLGISFVLNDWSWAFTKSVYGWNMQSRDTQPNFGILWYTFIMGFQRFRKFYVVLFAFYPYIFVIPIYLRLKSSAFEMVTLYAILGAVFKSHPTIHEVLSFMSLMLLSPHILIRMRPFSFISLISLCVPIITLFVDYHMWMFGGGNANYVYFMGVATMVFVSTIPVDFLTASIKHLKAAKLGSSNSMNSNDDIKSSDE